MQHVTDLEDSIGSALDEARRANERLDEIENQLADAGEMDKLDLVREARTPLADAVQRLTGLQDRIEAVTPQDVGRGAPGSTTASEE